MVRVCFLAVEPSGDLLAAEVAAELKAAHRSVELSGIGGDNLRAADVSMVDLDLSDLAIVGWWEGISAFQRVKTLAAKTADLILNDRPDAVVLVDSWGFTLRVARAIRAADPSIKLIKLIGPQVWASRTGRVRTVAETYDLVLGILDQEIGYYNGLNIEAEIIGHPAISRFRRGDAERFRQTYGLTHRDAVCLVCPGSRPAEAARVAPDLIEAGRDLRDAHKELRLVIAPANEIEEQVKESAGSKPDEIWINSNKLNDAMAAATLALACSGTVTTELACAGVPTLVGYRVSPITYALARAGFMRTTFITLLNVAAEEEVMPEFIQGALEPERLTSIGLHWLNNEADRQEQIAEQVKALERLAPERTPASQLAARAILKVLETP